MCEIRENISHIFHHVEQFKCLCEYNSHLLVKDLWYRMYEYSVKQKDIIEEKDNQLLCISFIRLLGEVCINITAENNSVCIVIQQLFEEFLSENLWNIFIYHLKSSEDKYLIWTFIKSFSIVLYACDKSTFSERVHELLCGIKEKLFVEKNMNILDFFGALVDFNIKQSTGENQIISCAKMIPSTAISFTDLFQSLCGLLSEYWPSFMEQFHDATTSKAEIPSLNRFLVLWQKLIEKHQGQHLFHTFLNEEYVFAFLSNACNLNVISLRIYTDIIMQFIISSVKSKQLEQNWNDSLDAAITLALENNFFNLLPRDFQISGLCVMTNMNRIEIASKSDSPNFKKCDSVIVRKVTFIFLSLIADVKNKKLLFDSVPKVLDFAKQDFKILPETNVYSWILDVFIDQDDILLGVMFALLRIYTVLCEEDTKEISQSVHLRNSLNPHEIFISFLKRIGFDHNELLSFLLSNETCFLFYLLQYLKLLLKECDTFMKAHKNLITADEDIFYMKSPHKIEESSIDYDPSPAKKLLVSYSSSSSEEDLQTVNYVSDRDQSSVIKSNIEVIHTLIKLRHAIQKLVGINEFPYNVSPLIILLQACEDKFVSL